jgi:hypothetical protein
MDIWIANFLPVKVLDILPAVTLILVGLIVETQYVGRIAIFMNAVALTTFFYKFTGLPDWLIWYINLSTIAGIIAILSYIFDESLPSEFYTACGFFSSVISGFILLYGLGLS